MLHRTRDFVEDRFGSNASMRLARSARLFCHPKLPKLLRCQSIPSQSFYESGGFFAAR
jgi:hypothetical protein